ncbi:unnamed protein product [Brachionus calyciflorus]|uniref:Uncharacterized protein n=1 Tax=Brachionus calyciflorus TaxID=104777 RepID=A0A813YE09_9BILA|nr:unnamed protein product [Brachionus calyciflorus]
MGKEALNSKNSKISKIESSIHKHHSTKTILDKPKALQTPLSLLNTTQSENNPIMDKLDALLTFCKELSAGQAEINKKLFDLDQSLKILTGRPPIDLKEDSINTLEASNFSKELIEQAKTRLSLDLDVDLVYNGKSLLRHLFNYTNINTYGTTLLSEIFKLRELNSGTVEPTKSTTPGLDQKRVDLIKVCYLKKLKTIEAFEHYWPSIIKSLRQKCIDIKTNIKKKGHLWYKLQEELIADGLVSTENNEEILEDIDENKSYDDDYEIKTEMEQMDELGLV